MAHKYRTLGESGRKLKLSNYVGFDSLPDQLVNRRKADGFDFNILVIGESGIGKHTLLDSLFKTQFDHTAAEGYANEVTLEEKSYELNEKGVRLRLNIVSTRGFGDQINKSNNVKPIVDHVETKFQEYLQQELKAARELKSFRDNRIHVCLYLLTPTGHSIKSIDLLCMKALHKRVNIIPLIAKSDTVSRAELDDYKQRILDELEANDIHTYTFPVDETPEVSEINTKLNGAVPFAVVGSRSEINLNGQKVRVRQYPWGIVEVENEAHSDFPKLREVLIRTNMEDLVMKTHSSHYEAYRQDNLLRMGYSDADSDTTISEAYAKKKADHERELARIEEEMRQSFVAKVKEKDSELQRTGLDLQSKYDRMMRDVKQQLKEVDETERRLITEMEQWRARMAAAAAQNSPPSSKKKDKKEKEKSK